MRETDAAALAHVSVEELVRRAGTAVAAKALQIMGGAYGRRVTVVAGKGNNGNDGRVAAGALAKRGARVEVLDAAHTDSAIPACDLVIDAAYGTGLAGAYTPPRVKDGQRVLAVDIASGVRGDTGEVPGGALFADHTVTFAALKPGLLMGEGPVHSGRVTVADIGVTIGEPSMALVEDADLSLVPRRARDAHKWASGVCVVAGSPGMHGAAWLCARGASRAGAGMVRVALRESRDLGLPIECVGFSVQEGAWAAQVLDELDRCRALVIGPGVGRDEATAACVREVIARAQVPVVADADALFALGDAIRARQVIETSKRPVVLTPHDGEYSRLAGGAPGVDRIAAARTLAASTGAVVLVKGVLTAVASPQGCAPSTPVLLAETPGGPALATAGTGDVLSGVLGALLARGVQAALAAGLAAHIEGSAGSAGKRWGLVSPDVPELVADWLSARGGDG
ncbi:MAG: NAD(P)H-hydrate dehydratase [Acidimicrobiales bacterium]